MEFSEFQLKEIFKNRKFDPPLKTLGGKSLDIIEVGTLNHDTGPDFKNSLVRIAGIAIRGDIEFHRHSSDWYSHGHQDDRNYNTVSLHIVGACNDSMDCITESGRKVDVLRLTDFLSSDVEEFLKWSATDEYPGSVKCARECHKLGLGEKLEYLRLLGEKRFAHKVGKFEERLKDIIEENRPAVFEAKQKYFKDFAELQIEHRTYTKSELRQESHWDQLLYEGILEGLGYSKNASAFKKLARNMPLSFLEENAKGERTAVEAMLFGASGLLPANLNGFDEGSRAYCEDLIEHWHGVKKKHKREFIDKSEWFFYKLRPQNFPTLRIAGASHLIADECRTISASDLIGRENSAEPEKILDSWRRFLVVPAGGYWMCHYVFGTPAAASAKMFIGAGRAEEIIINAFLPLMYLRGEIFEMEVLKDNALMIYSAHPPTPDNNITLLVKESLFGGDNVFSSVIPQQGSLHLYRTLCSMSRCERCKIGKKLYGKTAA